MATKSQNKKTRQELAVHALRMWVERNMDEHRLDHTDILAALFAVTAQRIAAYPSAQTRNLLLNSLEAELRCSVAAVLVEMHNGRK